jgi:hypothetical protein
MAQHVRILGGLFLAFGIPGGLAAVGILETRRLFEGSSPTAGVR